MLTLNFTGRLPTEAFIDPETLRSRILGPDMLGAYTQVTAVEHPDAGRTRVRLRAITHDQMLTMVIDPFGQYWLPLPERVGTQC